MRYRLIETRWITETLGYKSHDYGDLLKGGTLVSPEGHRDTICGATRYPSGRTMLWIVVKRVSTGIVEPYLAPPPPRHIECPAVGWVELTEDKAQELFAALSDWNRRSEESLAKMRADFRESSAVQIAKASNPKHAGANPLPAGVPGRPKYNPFKKRLG